MQRFFYRNLVSMLLAVLALAVAALLPFGGVASAATTICPTYGEVGIRCDLAISAPDSVASGQPFTVQVALGVVTEGGFTLLPKNDLCASNVVVTLKVFITEGTPFATYTANAKKGVATFNVGGLPAGEGPYSAELAVSAVQTTGYCGYRNEFLSVLVVNVPAGQPIAPCPNDVVCTQTTSGGGTAATLFTDNPTDTGMFEPYSGSDFFVTFTSVGGIGCGDGGPADPKGVLAYKFTGSASAPKHIIFELSPGLVNKGIGQINVCWKYPPSGDWFFLAACSKNVGPPCVVHKNALHNHGAMIEIAVPPGDPFVYVE